MMKTNLQTYKSHGLLIPACVAFLSMVSCTDDKMNQPEIPGDRIQFEVSASDSWNCSPQGRSASYSGGTISSSSVTLEAPDGNRLYLFPKVSRGMSERTSELKSRGSVVETGSIASAGVYAIYGAAGDDAFYMDNVEVRQENSWTPVDNYLWPGDGSLHFNAYSPFYDEASSTEGVTRLPGASAGSMTLDYITPADVASQIDLLWATPVDASSSPCNLEFNHALTAVKFVTGQKMVPCTIKSIGIVSVKSQGTLDISTGAWSDVSGNENYEVELDKSLTAESGSGYVAADFALTSAEQTFILLPQTLGEDSKVVLTIELDGKTSSFEASVAGQVWEEGTTVTYRLSANPSEPELLLQIVDADGNNVEKLSTKYTGSQVSYTVKSSYDDGNGVSTPISWKAAFIDADGKELASAPDWIADMVMNGNGDSACVLATTMVEPIFLEMSEQTRMIRNTADINAASGQARYNLSSATGASAIENTANCYIINASGKYSLPLVYGNAIKGGVTNESSYISTLSQTTANKRKALFHFINHLGNEISDPYIYNNVECVPEDAVLLWEDRVNLIRNTTLSADKKSLEFDVPQASVRQGNALVAVRDKDENVLWSWHIWVTDYVPDDNWQQMPSNGSLFPMYSRNVGRIYGGDNTEFKAVSATVRFTQTGVPEGMTPLSVDVAVEQAGTTIYTGDCYTYYQWGRKDPIISGLDRYYDADHNEMDGTAIPEQPVGSDYKEMIKTTISHPQIFISGNEADVRKMTSFYVNMWTINQIPQNNNIQPENVKTIYDPNPVGSKVPVGNAFHGLDSITGTYDASKKEVAIPLPNGEVFEYTTLGYRRAAGGETMNESSGQCWTVVAGNAANAKYLSVGTNGQARFVNNIILFGFAMRPAKETN